MDIRTVTNVQDAWMLEKRSYPEDEAASWDQLVYRHRVAPELFLGAFEDGVLVGFVVATAATETTLTHASMHHHDPQGKTICIHSVCVTASHRRQGVATRLLKAFVERVRGMNVDRIALIAHSELIPLYEKCGFVLIGRSSVPHGQLPWYELHCTLG